MLPGKEKAMGGYGGCFAQVQYATAEGGGGPPAERGPLVLVAGFLILLGSNGARV